MINEQSGLDRLLGLTITTDLKILTSQEVGKQVSKMIGSFYWSSKMLTPEAVLYLYKSQVRPKIEYCAHIWTCASKALFLIKCNTAPRDELVRSFSPPFNLSHIVGMFPARHCSTVPGIVPLSYELVPKRRDFFLMLLALLNKQ